MAQLESSQFSFPWKGCHYLGRVPKNQKPQLCPTKHDSEGGGMKRKAFSEDWALSFRQPIQVIHVITSTLHCAQKWTLEMKMHPIGDRIP